MPRSQGFDADRVAAVCAVALAHLGVVWLLSRPSSPTPPSLRDDALQIVWIEAPPAPAAPTMPSASRSRPPNPAAPRTAPLVSPAPPPAASADATPAASRSLSAVFVEQGRAWARAQAAPEDFSSDPLRGTRPRDAQPRAERFVMRDAITPASLAAGIGTLFGGAGYDRDPCPRIDDNITALATGGPGELLDEELRRRRRLCR